MLQQLPAADPVRPAPAAPPPPHPPAAALVDESYAECRHLADVPLHVEAILDRLVLNVREVADLQPGSLITLTRSAGDNVDLYIGGVRIASGEIVLIENAFGVRITDLAPDL